MKRTVPGILIVGLLLSGCATPPDATSYSGPTHVVVTGAPGVVVMGCYVQEGQRVSFSNAVPWHLDLPHLSELVIQVPKGGGPANVALHYEAGGIDARANRVLDSNFRGAAVRVEHGFILRSF